MDMKLLKDKTLQLAIQGKLVAQNESDEPASALLEKIKAEKEQLIKDKVIKKEKPLPEINDEEKLFDIPKTWEWSRLGSIANIVMGQSPDSSSVSETIGGVEFHQGKASFGKILINNSGLYCTKPTKLAIADDVLLSVRAPVGTLNITDRELCIGRGLTAIRRYIEIDNKFFYYFIMALEEELVKKATGTTFKAVASTAIKEFLIPLPPLEEQKRIVAKVEELFELIDELDSNKQDLLENITNSRNKVLQLAIQGKLVEQCEDDEPASVLLEKIKEEKEQLIKDKVIKKEKPLPEISEEEKEFDLPKGWEWCRLGQIGIYKKGPFGSALTKSMFVPKGENTIKVYEQKNAIKKDYTLGDYYVTKEYFESKLKGFEIFEGDIIVSCAGTIGETYIMPNGIEKGIINQALMKMKIFDGIDIGYFLMYFDFILKKTAKESSKGSAIKNIPPFDIFKKMILPLPPLQEQKRIIFKVNLIMDYLDKLQQEIESQEIILEDILQ